MPIRIPPKTDQDAKDSTEALQAAAGGGAPDWDDIQNKPSTFPPPAATASVMGGVLQGAAVADATAGTEVETINAMLASLRASGAIAT